MDFLELAKRRCTTREFIDKQIDKDDLNRILSAGRVAPSASNKQPQRIIVVQRPDNISKVQFKKHIKLSALNVSSLYARTKVLELLGSTP